MLNLGLVHTSVTPADMAGVSALLAILADPAETQKRLDAITAAIAKHQIAYDELQAARAGQAGKAEELAQREQSVTAREQAITGRETDVATKARDNADRSANLDAKEANLSQREVALAAGEKALDEQRARLRSLAAGA